MVLKYQIWDQSGTNMVEPSADKFQNGFAEDYSPKSEEINYLWRMITENRVPVGTTIFTLDPGQFLAMSKGYVALQGGIIGSVSSGASYWASDLAEDIFTHLWNNDATIVVTPSKGASAAADWSANKTITLPAMWGVGIGGVSTVSGSIFNAPVGTVVGEETVTLTEAQLPAITPTVTDPGHSHNITFNTMFVDGSQQQQDKTPRLDIPQPIINPETITTSVSTTGISVSSFGGNEAHSNVQPTLLGYFWMKY